MSTTKDLDKLPICFHLSNVRIDKLEAYINKMGFLNLDTLKFYSKSNIH